MVVVPDEAVAVESRCLQHVAGGRGREADHMDRRLLPQIRRYAAEEGHQLGLRIDPDALQQAQVARQQHGRSQRIPVGMGEDRHALGALRPLARCFAQDRRSRLRDPRPPAQLPLAAHALGRRIALLSGLLLVVLLVGGLGLLHELGCIG